MYNITNMIAELKENRTKSIDDFCIDTCDFLQTLIGREERLIKLQFNTDSCDFVCVGICKDAREFIQNTNSCIGLRSMDEGNTKKYNGSISNNIRYHIYLEKTSNKYYVVLSADKANGVYTKEVVISLHGDKELQENFCKNKKTEKIISLKVNGSTFYVHSNIWNGRKEVSNKKHKFLFATNKNNDDIMLQSYHH